MLAAIAAARKRPDDARAQAALAEQALPSVPFSGSPTRVCRTTRTSARPRSPAFDAVVAALDDRPAPFDGLHWLRGDCLVRLDRQPEALEAFERAVTEAPFDLRAYASLATSLHAATRDDDAMATVERLVR